MNEYLEATKKYILNLLPSVPTFITENWLLQALENDDFLRWGFVFSDLSNCIFDSNISEETLRRVSISSYTKLPKKHPFNLDLEKYIDNNIQVLQSEGITGKNVNIAVIDQGFSLIHDELKECLKEYKDYQSNSHSFHGLSVVDSLAGKSFGIAPKSNIYFYGHREADIDLICKDTISALKEIYEKNLKGANIKIVNISGYAHTLSNEYAIIKEKLKNTGCYIIDSPIFGENFTCINERTNGEKTKYYFSKWQLEKPENWHILKSKIAIPFTGITPLWNTEHDYKIGGDTSYSWAIPRLSGIYALCLQLKPKMTLDELLELIIETKNITEDGIQIINPQGMIEKLKQDLSTNKTL